VKNSFKTQLIEIALRDLKAASILYENKLYAQSYFLFQQASEKSNKAFGISTDLIDEKESKKLSHNQLELLNISANSLLLEIEKFKLRLTENPEIEKHQLINKIDLKSNRNSIIQGLDYIKSLQKIDSLNFSNSDYKYFIETLKELYEFRFKIDRKSLNKLKISIDIYLDFIEKFATLNDSIEVKKVFAEENRVAVTGILENFAKHQFRIIFIYYTFFFCAIVTAKHSTSPRYPNNNNNPLLFYRKSNTLVKFQPVLMDYLNLALKMFKKYESDIYNCRK